VNFVLLIGFLSLSACAAFVTLRSRSLNRTPDCLPAVYKDNVVPFSYVKPVR
jgi:hypothetical protein